MFVQISFSYRIPKFAQKFNILSSNMKLITPMRALELESPIAVQNSSYGDS